jgi:hypothetical protein
LIIYSSGLCEILFWVHLVNWTSSFTSSSIWSMQLIPQLSHLRLTERIQPKQVKILFSTNALRWSRCFQHFFILLERSTGRRLGTFSRFLMRKQLIIYRWEFCEILFWVVIILSRFDYLYFCLSLFFAGVIHPHLDNFASWYNTFH